MRGLRIRRGLLPAAGLILAVLGLSGLGIADLVDRYERIVSGDGVVEEAGKMRNGVFALIDIDRLATALNAREDSETDPNTSLSKAIDMLFVRADTFRRTLGDTASPQAQQVVAALEALVDAADAASQDGLPRPDIAVRIAPAMQEARQSVMRYYDQQKIMHQRAMDVQEAALRRMTLVAAALLGVFAVISGIAVALWRSEIIARHRRREAEEEAHRLAWFDPLTGIFNRSRFRTEFDRLLARDDQPLLMLIDLDGFKAVNDRYGHQAGDRLLIAVARRLSGCAAAQGGAAARLGGDEFAVCLPGPAGAPEASARAQALIRRLRAPVDWEGTLLHPRCSVGIAWPAVLPVREAPCPATLMRAADQALYRAKEAGKDSFCLFDPDMAEQEARQRRLREAMPAALERGEFLVEFQPQVWLSDGRLHGFEALVRWQHDGVTIPPDQFVPLAEASGFVGALDLWVLRRALEEATGWGIPADRMPNISVNLSAQHFRDTRVVDHVHTCLAETGFPARRLTLEITEGVLIEDWETTSTVLAALRDLGAHTALDDFGTGYSSMSYLRRLAVSEVKIDRSFVMDLETSAQTRMVLDGLVDIVAALDMRLVVEGIETEAQARILAGFGARIGQGYLFGRSLSGLTARDLALSRDPGPVRAAV